MKRLSLALLLLIGCTELAPDYDLAEVSLTDTTIHPPQTVTCEMDFTGSTETPSVASCVVRSVNAYEFNGCSSMMPNGQIFACDIDFGATYTPTGVPYTEGAWIINYVSALDSDGIQRMMAGYEALDTDDPGCCDFNLGGAGGAGGTPSPPVMSAGANRDIDELGWSILNPSADSHIVHVSNTAQGNSNVPGCGAITAPCTTLTYALNTATNRPRDGYADWVLLKKGDTFTPSTSETPFDVPNGRSRTEQTLIGSYGTGNRPVIRVGLNESFFVSNSSDDAQNIAFVGLWIYSYLRDDTTEDWSEGNAGSAGGTGFMLNAADPANPIRGILIEDCEVSHFNKAIEIEHNADSTTTDNAYDIYLRRNIFRHSWSGTGTEAQGVFIRAARINAEGNYYHHNGWRIRPATVYRHNNYLAIQISGTQLIENVLSDGAHNNIKTTSKLGSDNIGDNIKINNNLSISGETPFDIGEGDGADGDPYIRWTNFEMNDNVLIAPNRDNPTGRDTNVGWMIDIMNPGPGTEVNGNLLLNQTKWKQDANGVEIPGQLKAGIRPIRVGRTGATIWEGLTISGNTIYNISGTLPGIDIWETDGASAPVVITNNVMHFNSPHYPQTGYEDDQRCLRTQQGTGVGVITWGGNKCFSRRATGEWTQLNGTNMTLAAWNSATGDTATALAEDPTTVFADPVNATLEYYVSNVLGETPATVDRFIALFLAQSKDSWDYRLEANYINQWFRAKMASSSVSVYPSKPDATWILYGPSAFNGGQGYLEGTGNYTGTGLPTGNYYVEWGWMLNAWPPVAFDSQQSTDLAAIGVTAAVPDATNGPWSTANQNYNGTKPVSFFGGYTPRRMSKDATSVGINIQPDRAYRGSDMQSDLMHGRSTRRDYNSPEEWSTDWDWAYPVYVRINSPYGRPAACGSTIDNNIYLTPACLQDYHVYWKGTGTITLVPQGAGIGNIPTINITADGTGQSGAEVVQLYSDHDLGDDEAIELGKPDPFGAWMTVDATGSVYDVEIVHEDYVGPTPSAPLHRKVSADGWYLTRQGKELARNARVFRYLEHTNNTNYRNESEMGAGWFEGAGRYPTEMGERIGAIIVEDGFQQTINICNAAQVDCWLTFPCSEEPYNNPTMPTANRFIEIIEEGQNGNGYDGTAGGGLAGPDDLYPGHPGLRVIVEYCNETWNDGLADEHGADFVSYWAAKLTGKSVSGRGDTISPTIPAQPAFTDLNNVGGGSFDVRARTRYTAYRLWKLYEAYSTNPAFTAKVPGIYSSIDDRVDFALMSATGRSNDFEVYMRRVTGGGAPDPNGAYVQFDGETDPVDVFRYFGTQFYDAPSTSQAANAPFDDEDPAVSGETLVIHGPEWRDKSTTWWSYTKTKADEWAAQNCNDYANSNSWDNTPPFIANNPPLKIANYEGGPNHNTIVPTSYPGSPVKAEFQQYVMEHPAMYGAVYWIYDCIGSSFGQSTLFLHYTSSQAWDAVEATGEWGIKKTANQPNRDARKYQAWVDWQYLNPRSEIDP